ncbi:MAG: DUF1428 domain-containing protein [Henriciella sp.]|nr:DUF1428 domain-containing protein [Henriciella sp.]
MTYIDGFVLPVPIARKGEYIALAKSMSEAFKKYGALKVMEFWGAEIPEGEVTSFPKAVALKEGETVVMAINIWPSKDVRDKGYEQLMEDPIFSGGAEMPFDGKRMILGEFETILNE